MDKRIYIDGNNGGNFIQIDKLDDNRIHLQVGDCCVHTVNVIFTAEVLSNFLTQLTLEENKSLLEIAESKLGWSKEINKKYLENCKTL